MVLTKRLSLAILIVAMVMSSCLSIAAGGNGDSVPRKYSEMQTSKLQSVDTLNKYNRTDHLL